MIECSQFHKINTFGGIIASVGVALSVTALILFLLKTHPAAVRPLGFTGVGVLVLGSGALVVNAIYRKSSNSKSKATDPIPQKTSTEKTLSPSWVLRLNETVTRYSSNEKSEEFIKGNWERAKEMKTEWSLDELCRDLGNIHFLLLTSDGKLRSIEKKSSPQSPTITENLESSEKEKEILAAVEDTKKIVSENMSCLETNLLILNQLSDHPTLNKKYSIDEVERMFIDPIKDYIQAWKDSFPK